MIVFVDNCENSCVLETPLGLLSLEVNIFQRFHDPYDKLCDYFRYFLREFDSQVLGSSDGFNRLQNIRCDLAMDNFVSILRAA